MKKIFVLIAGLSLMTSVASASTRGTPDQDPIVKDLRQRFQDGKQRDSAELLKNTYACKEILAKRNKFEQVNFPSTLTFSQFDGYLIKHLVGEADGQLYINNGKELIASLYVINGIATSAYRIDSKGYLIAEWSNSVRDQNAELAPLAETASESRVFSYQLCVVKP